MAFMTALIVSLTIQNWTPRASASDDLKISDLLSTTAAFPSGFQAMGDCNGALTNWDGVLREFLSKPLDEFRQLSFISKLREIHTVADALFRGARADRTLAKELAVR